jgi:hypothetical protein
MVQIHSRELKKCGRGEMEDINCPVSGKLLARISVEHRKLYCWCKLHHQSHSINLQPYIDRMLASNIEPDIVVDQDEEGNIRIIPR